MAGRVKKLIVDTWRTGLHGEKIGFRQREQWMSKSRAFTRDMDIIGRIKEDDIDIGLLGIRENAWKGRSMDGKEDRLRGRLILRTFSKDGQWLGSIEEMVAWELGNSIAVNSEIPSFAVIMPNYDYLVPVRKVHQRVTMRESFTFELMNPKTLLVDVFELKSEAVSVGSDWHLYYRNVKDDQEVALLDSKRFDIGGKVEISIYDEEFATNQALKNVLALFSSSIKYHGEVKDRIKSRINELRAGKRMIRPTKGELWLMRNPRRFGARH
ncbi:MAG: hypothetical protein ACFE7S_09135 [Candidatus Hodarchaeota archaeon]